MATLIREIQITLFAGQRQMSFTTVEDLEGWLEIEGSFWLESSRRPVDSNLINYWNEQSNFFAHAINYTKKYASYLEESNAQRAQQIHDVLNSHLQRLGSGEIVTSDSELFPAIVDLSTHSVDVAALVMLAARSDADSTLGRISNTPVKALVKLSLLNSRAKGSKDWLIPHRKELTALQSQYRSELNTLQLLNDARAADFSKLYSEGEKAGISRDSAWNEQTERFGEEWLQMKRVYDEQLALLAPTQYWDKRAKAHATWSGVIAIFFTAVLGSTLATFVVLGSPHLLAASLAKDVSPLLTLIPVLIPAFAAIWVLKILSRLLSENLQMMRDARERETMVKTFLALMRDEERGKALVRDEDRILILHALFRPSTVNAVDDAPPVHWFDILSNKVGAKKP